MDADHTYSSDVAFTPSVKAVQARRGSRKVFAHREEAGAWPTQITPELAAFIAEQTSVFLATANKEGQPYIQHRGGPPGFLRVLDDKTIGFADFAGNRQYITLGNLTDNPKAYLFLIDYMHRGRIKIVGRGARRRRRCGACRQTYAGRLQSAAGAGDPLHRRGLGFELRATHSAAF